jgi:hypothetical protein
MNHKDTTRELARVENVIQALKYLIEGGTYPSGRSAGPLFLQLARTNTLVQSKLLIWTEGKLPIPAIVLTAELLKCIRNIETTTEPHSISLLGSKSNSMVTTG